MYIHANKYNRYIGVTGRILLHHFCYLLGAALGDDATKVMVPSETGNSTRLRDARDLWSVVTTTFYYFPSNATLAWSERERKRREARLLGDVGDDKGNTWNVIRRSKLDNTHRFHAILREIYKEINVSNSGLLFQNKNSHFDSESMLNKIGD